MINHVCFSFYLFFAPDLQDLQRFPFPSNNDNIKDAIAFLRLKYKYSEDLIFDTMLNNVTI